MKNFSAVAKLPEVLGAALADSSGAVLETAGPMDGETAGAVYAFTVRAFGQVGDTLGLSQLERLTLGGDKSTILIAVQEGFVLGATVDPSKPLASVEKKFWDTITK